MGSKYSVTIVQAKKKLNKVSTWTKSIREDLGIDLLFFCAQNGSKQRKAGIFMNKHEFYNNVVEGVKAKLGDDFAVNVMEVMKINITLDGLTILHKSENISPTIYLNRYKEHFDAGRPMDDIIDDILSIYESNRHPENISVEQFYDFDKLKDKIIVKVINTEKNEKLLEEVPHLVLNGLDLTVILYVSLESHSDTMMGFQVRNNHLKLWDVSFDDILPLAAKNTNRIYNFVVKSMTEVLLSDLFDEDIFDNDDATDCCDQMYILTSAQGKTLGSSQLFLKDKIKEFADRCECDLYILPSSIHELILLRTDFACGSVDELKVTVNEVNETVLSAEDFLSNNVYYYNRQTEEITKL